MDRFFDPRHLPDGGQSLAHAIELCSALALLDEDDPRAWRRCRGAALRYLDAVRGGRFGAAVALDLLRRAVASWTPRTLDTARRARLDTRVPFWVGTVYGLRWQAVIAPDAIAQRAPVAVAPAGVASGPHPPEPLTVEGLRERRERLRAERDELASRRATLRETTARRQARSTELCRTAADRIVASLHLRDAARQQRPDGRRAPDARDDVR